jgi:hypothetical protein
MAKKLVKPQNKISIDLKLGGIVKNSVKKI